ncbi:FAD-binding protein [Streptomyces sp. NPDC054962]
MFAEEVDVVVAGSGAGGMVAALAAHHEGLDVLVVEKSSYFGGSSVLSGGSIWIPNAPAMTRRGYSVPPESVVEYLRAITEGKISASRIERFVHSGPEMLSFLEGLGPRLRFIWRPDYPDYHPDAPGGSATGRSIEAVPLDRRDLGVDDHNMRQPVLRIPRGMWMTSADLHSLLRLRRNWRGKATFVRLLTRMVRGVLTGARVATRGEALVGRLRLALRDAGVPLWLGTPLSGLITEDGAITGLVVERAGVPVRIRARCGVVLATGGFDHNLELRRRHQPLVTHDWSMGAPDDTGDGILTGLAAGADSELMDDAWWMPAIPWGGGKLGLLLFERQIPGQFVVNGAGRRYTNEAGPYTDFVHDMLAGQAAGTTHIPSWLIIDDRSWRRYMFAGHLPLPRLPGAPVPTGRRLPKEWAESGSVQIAETWAELAAKIGVPAGELARTAARFNDFARQGRDDDFHRGENAYDNYYGDPSYPNPNLCEVVTPPYYAFKIVPGDLGTKGGLRTDADARVLDRAGAPIAGLYAVGNVAAALTGTSYAGPGGTIAPAMTFGYIAARHIAGRLSADPGTSDAGRPGDGISGHG